MEGRASTTKVGRTKHLGLENERNSLVLRCKVLKLCQASDLGPVPDKQNKSSETHRVFTKVLTGFTILKLLALPSYMKVQGIVLLSTRLSTVCFEPHRPASVK